MDVYKTIKKPSGEILFKERKSKFYGYAFPIMAEDDVKPIVESLRKKYPSANHVCYAWQLGVEKTIYRANDDGEPNNSAGMPIYGQIQSFKITNVLVVVVRIFGGVKLGVGGLISAYRTGAQMALEASVIIEKTVNILFKVNFGYPEMDIVMRTLKQKQLEIVSQTLQIQCEIIFSVRKGDAPQVREIFDRIYRVGIDQIKN